MLFTGGLGLVLEPMAQTLLDVVERLPESTTVVVDPNCRPQVIADRDRYGRHLERVLARADIIKVSDEDLDYLMPGVDPDSASARLLDSGSAAVVVTGGAGATRLVTPDGSREIPVTALHAPVVDTIGAGDTFGAALIVAWVRRGGQRAQLRQGGALDELTIPIEAAHEAAAVVVTRRGADPPWRHDLPDTWATSRIDVPPA